MICGIIDKLTRLRSSDFLNNNKDVKFNNDIINTPNNQTITFS